MKAVFKFCGWTSNSHSERATNERSCHHLFRYITGTPHVSAWLNSPLQTASKKVYILITALKSRLEIGPRLGQAECSLRCVAKGLSVICRSRLEWDVGAEVWWLCSDLQAEISSDTFLNHKNELLHSGFLSSHSLFLKNILLIITASILVSLNL